MAVLLHYLSNFFNTNSLIVHVLELLSDHFCTCNCFVSILHGLHSLKYSYLFLMKLLFFSFRYFHLLRIVPSLTNKVTHQSNGDSVQSGYFFLWPKFFQKFIHNLFLFFQRELPAPPGFVIWSWNCFLLISLLYFTFRETLWIS